MKKLILKKVLNEWFLFTLLMTLIFILINYGLLSGNSVGIWDTDGSYMPYQVLLADHARDGKFVLWDVWSNGGVPALGDPQRGAFSPINVLIGFITGGSTLGFVIFWLFVWWLGGLGVMILGHHFKTTSWGAFIIALQYLFIGIYITNAEHVDILAGFSFIPFIIWRLDTALNSKRLLPAVQAGAFWGVSALGSYPAFTILTVMYCGLWVLGRLLFDKNGMTDWSIFLTNSRKSLITLIVFLLVGTIILSPTYFSFLYELAGTTTRVGTLTKEAVISENPFHPGAISTFSSPYISVQKFYNTNLWVGTDISMTGIYAGIITFLALFAIINSENRWHWWVLFIALLALCFSLSQVFPFRGWLYDLVYPTRFFRHSSLFRAYYLFSITVLALMGISDLASLLKRKSSHRWKNYKTTSLVISTSAVLVFISTVNSLSAQGGKTYLAYSQVFVIWLGICLIPFGAKWIFPEKRSLIIPAFLILLVVFDVFCVYQISKPLMMSDDLGAVNRWKRLNQQHSANLELKDLSREESSCLEENPPCINFSNDHLIKKIPVINTYATQINSYLVEMKKYPILKNMAIGKERIWFTPTANYLSPTTENFTKFAELSNLSQKVPLVVQTRKEMLNTAQNNKISDFSESLKESPPLQRIDVSLQKYAPTELIFDVFAPTDGWLLVTDRWARSWKAEINNRSTEVFGGNFIFRAIQVSQGNNKVRFYYEPVGFPILLIISWGTILIVIAITLYKRKREE